MQTSEHMLLLNSTIYTMYVCTIYVGFSSEITAVRSVCIFDQIQSYVYQMIRSVFNDLNKQTNKKYVCMKCPKSLSQII